MWEIKKNKKDRIYMWWGNLAIQKRWGFKIKIKYYPMVCVRLLLAMRDILSPKCKKKNCTRASH